jgi:flagellum-specific peptidoglycan hydrolase FlgJ
MEPEEFIAWLGPTAQRICTKYGLFPSVCIAQAALETGWGKYVIGEYNLFGRKWDGWGGYIEKPTKEYIDGKWITVLDKFQGYDSLDQALEDYCMLITEEPIYQPCLQYLGNLEAFVQTLGPIYATDPNYAGKILRIIKANDLTNFDPEVL